MIKKFRSEVFLLNVSNLSTRYQMFNIDLLLQNVIDLEYESATKKHAERNESKKSRRKVEWRKDK